MRLNSTVDSRDASRLHRQSVAILAMLRERPRTNTELYAVAINASARLSEIREHLRVTTGEELIAKRGVRGIWTYSIEPAPKLGQLDLLGVA